MTNRLRSSSVRDHEVKKPQTPPAVKEKVDDKGLIVKFHRIRNSELTHLNNEAENFLFPKKEESSDDDVDADGPNTTASSGMFNLQIYHYTNIFKSWNYLKW